MVEAVNHNVSCVLNFAEQLESTQQRAHDEIYNKFPFSLAFDFEVIDQLCKCGLSETGEEHLVNPLDQRICPQCNQQFCGSCRPDDVLVSPRDANFQKCPTCNVLTLAVDDPEVENGLNGIRVKCPIGQGNGCDKIPFGNLGTHMQQNHLQCPNNCGQTDLNALNLQKHLEQDCPDQVLSCSKCNNTRNKFLRKANHICVNDFFGQISALMIGQKSLEEEVTTLKQRDQETLDLIQSLKQTDKELTLQANSLKDVVTQQHREELDKLQQVDKDVHLFMIKQKQDAKRLEELIDKVSKNLSAKTNDFKKEAEDQLESVSNKIKQLHEETTDQLKSDHSNLRNNHDQQTNYFKERIAKKHQKAKQRHNEVKTDHQSLQDQIDQFDNNLKHLKDTILPEMANAMENDMKQLKTIHDKDILKLNIIDEAQSAHFYETLVATEKHIGKSLEQLQCEIIFEEHPVNISSVTIDRSTQFYPSREQVIQMSYDQLKAQTITTISCDVSQFICHLSFGFPNKVQSPPLQSGGFSANMGVAILPKKTVLRALYFGVHDVYEDNSWYLCSIRAYDSKNSQVANIDGSWKITRTLSIPLTPTDRIISCKVDSNSGVHPVQIVFLICDLDKVTTHKKEQEQQKSAIQTFDPRIHISKAAQKLMEELNLH